MNVEFPYLSRQFDADLDLTKLIFDDIHELARSGDFTLGKAVTDFEANIKAYMGLPPAGSVTGVHSGTAALTLCLQAMGIGPGDDVVTVPNTFYATVGAIVRVGSNPVFCDVNDRYSMDPTKLDAAITRNTKAVIPVHWYGMPADMDPIRRVATDHGCYVIEDACASVGARYKGRPVGSMGDANAISLHPLKTLHVWGDGGAVIIPYHPPWTQWLRLYRSHGMLDRDTISLWGVNERLHTIQAIVANREYPLLETWTDQRIAVANRLDEGLADIPEILIPPRHPDFKNAYQLYVIQTLGPRDQFLDYLIANGVDAKVHYPTPLHLQPAAAELRHAAGLPLWARGDFPVAEEQARRIVTLPCSQYLRPEEADHIVETVRSFYA